MQEYENRLKQKEQEIAEMREMNQRKESKVKGYVETIHEMQRKIDDESGKYLIARLECQLKDQELEVQKLLKLVDSKSQQIRVLMSRCDQQEQ